MHSFDDQRLAPLLCDKGVAFLVTNADKKCKFSKARVVVNRWAGTNASRDHQYLVERQAISTI